MKSCDYKEKMQGNLQYSLYKDNLCYEIAYICLMPVTLISYLAEKCVLKSVLITANQIRVGAKEHSYSG